MSPTEDNTHLFLWSIGHCSSRVSWTTPNSEPAQLHGITLFTRLCEAVCRASWQSLWSDAHHTPTFFAQKWTSYKNEPSTIFAMFCLVRILSVLRTEEPHRRASDFLDIFGAQRRGRLSCRACQKAGYGNNLNSRSTGTLSVFLSVTSLLWWRLGKITTILDVL